MSCFCDWIKRLCPDGVKFQPIGIICDTITDYTAAGSFADIAKNVHYLSTQSYAQLVRTTDLKTKFSGKTPVYVDEHAFHYLWRVNLDRPSLILPNIGNCGEVYYCQPQDFPSANNVLGPNAILLRSSTANLKYLFHLFQTPYFQNKLSAITSTVGQGKFNKTSLKKITIPVPPLEVQCEIVRILDAYTKRTADLIAGLSAELEAREKQRNYYFAKLIGEPSYERELLSNVAFFQYGYTDKAKSSGDARFIRITDILPDGHLNPMDAKYVDLDDSSKDYLLKYGDLLMARTGATFGKTLFFEGDEPSVFASFLIKIVLNNSVLLNKYYWYFSKSPLFWEQANKLVTSGGQPQFNANALKQVLIPIPPLEVQKEIVRLLDSIDGRVSGLLDELTREIEVRKKQYDYYRNLLLAFEEAK